MNQGDRRQYIARLAPVAPPCFSSRGQWIEWLALVSDKPLIFEAGRPVRFNTALRFCADCTAEHKATMQRAGQCEPAHLRMLEALPA